MKIKKHRSLAAALAVMLMLTGCAKETEKTPESENLNAETVLEYKSSSAEITEEIKGDFEDFEYYNGKIYFLSEFFPDEEKNNSEYYLNIADIDGSNFSSVLFSPLGKHILTVPEFDENGTGYYIDVNAEDSDKNTYSLNKTDADGKLTETIDITEKIAGNGEDEYFFYPHKTAVSGELICIASYDRLLVLTKEGELVCDIREDIEGIQDIVSGADGKVYVSIYDMSGSYVFRGTDTASGQLEKGTALPLSGYSSDTKVIKGNNDNDFFLSDGTSLRGFNIENGQLNENDTILEWLKAGISMLEVNDIFADNDIIITAGKSYPHGLPKISVLTKQPVNNGGKKEIVLAGSEYAISSYIENNIIRFNNENDSYYVTVKKYSNDDEDISNQINLDFVSGKIPDILITDAYIPIDNFISKGFFADMYEFIDRDSELKREDFLPNLLEAFETNGKLYRFTDSFEIYTVLGKESIFGKENGITIDRLNEIAAQRPNAEMFPGVTKNDILTYATELSGGDFLDHEKQTCNFKSEQFMKILEYANSYPDNVDDYFENHFDYDVMFKNEKALLMNAYLTSYADVFRYEKSEFGENVTAVGFPSENGNGTSFIVNSGFAIIEKSENKSGAWEFVRTLLLADYQDEVTEFPVRNDSLEKAAQTAMKHDPDRDNVSYVVIGQIMFGSNTYDIGEPKQTDIDKMNKIIALADGIMSYDSSVSDIISEEASAYFSGVRSVQETAELIEQRVLLYLNEKNS